MDLVSKKDLIENLNPLVEQLSSLHEELSDLNENLGSDSLAEISNSFEIVIRRLSDEIED